MTNPLRIGVDARNLIAPMTGIGRYVHELSRELTDADHDVILYLPEAPSAALPALERAQMRIGRMPGPLLRQAWAHSSLPLQIRNDQLDIFWGPAHRLPPLLPHHLPRVLTIHDLVWVHAPDTMRTRTRLAEQAFMKRSVARADIVVVDTDATGHDLIEAIPGLDVEIVTIHAGVTDKHAGRTERGQPDFGIDRPYVLFVGTLEPRKNLTRLLDAWKLLPAELRDAWRLVIAGGKGWGMDSLKTEIAARDIAASVRMTGYVSDEQLADLYSGAGLLAMPSLYEGFGLPIVEANARGVPALTSNLSCMPEIAGPDAILVDPYSASSIADGLSGVLSGRRDHAALSAAARANAGRFDWGEAARLLVGVFHRAIAMRKAA